MSDGSRVFETFTIIPSIVFNTLLNGPRNLSLYAFNTPEKTGIANGEYYPFARWDVPQLEEAHPGINKITLVFQEQRDNADWITARFVYEAVDEFGVQKWVLNHTNSDKGDVVSELYVFPLGPVDTFRRFEVRFPMTIVSDYVADFGAGISINSDGRLLSKGKNPETEKEIDSAFSAYNFIITLEDQYGLIAQSGFDDGPLANETTILDSVIVKDLSGGAVINEGFYIPGFVNYTMDIPYDISSVLIEYVKNPDYPDQLVEFASGSNLFDIPQGNTRNINFTVAYGNDDPTGYVLTITRLSPVRDSRLESIYAEIPAGRYDTLPAFIPDNSGNTYAIYLPSQINSITLNALLPQMRPGDPGYGTPMYPEGTLIPSIVGIDGYQNGNPPRDGSYKRVHGRWTLPLDFGSNLFHIVVTPEAGLATTYTVTAIRAHQSSNDTADLAGLAITGNSSGSVPLMPSVFDGRKQESYTANVPHADTGVTISATVYNTRARVTNVRTPGIADGLEVVKNGNTFQANLTGLEAGGSYPVTITVVGPDGASRRDYHVLVNRMLPVPVPLSTKEQDRAIVVSWNPVALAAGLPGTVGYELYFHTAAISSPAQITAAAVKWPGTPSVEDGARTARITGLENAQRYYFWLRAMNGTIPGEWRSIGADTVIQPRSSNPNLASAALTGGNITSPVFAPSVTVYTVIIPCFPGSLTITGSKGEPNQTLTPVSGSITLAPDAGDSETGIIGVQAHDPLVSRKDYQFTVHRRLPPPEWGAHSETNNQVTLNWNPVAGASLYDLRYHTAAISGPALIEQEAVPLDAPVTGTSCVISGLDNARTYYFWVRARITGVPVVESVPGEWSQVKTAMPKSNDTTLSNISVAGGPPLIPLNFNPAVKNYSIIIPSVPGSFNVTGSKAEPNQQIGFAVSGGMVPPLPGGSTLITFTVTAHDGTNSSPPYTVRVDRMLGGPQWAAPPVEGVGKVTLSWNTVASGGPLPVYETYYNTGNTPPPAPPAVIDSGDTKWMRGISGTAVEVDGLTNGTRYYFWVRAVAGTVPGEWSAVESAMPKNNNARLALLSVRGNDGVDYISPAEYDGDTFTYVRTAPAGAGHFTFTIAKDYTEQEITFSRSGGSAGTGNTGANSLDAGYVLDVENGKTASLAVTVRPHDGSAPNIYTVMINRMPVTAVVQTAAKNRAVDLSWNAAAGASAYELYWHTAPGQIPPDSASMLNVAGTNVRLEGLTNTVLYYFWLRSKAEGGLGGTIYGEWTRANTTPLSDVAELSSLSASEGSLSPAFRGDVETYYLLTPPGASGPFTLNASAADGGTVDAGAKTINLNDSVSFTVHSQDSNNSKMYTVYTRSAGVSVTFVQPEDSDETIELLPAAGSVSWAADTPLTLAANGSFGGYELQWYRDSQPIAGANEAVLNTSAREFSIARHTVTLRIKAADGHIYSKSLSFTVER